MPPAQSNFAFASHRDRVRSQVVAGDPELREAVCSEIIERDSLIRFIHRGVRHDSLGSRPVAHKHYVYLLAVHFYFPPLVNLPPLDQYSSSTGLYAVMELILFLCLFCYCVLATGAHFIYFIIPLGSS